MVNDIRGVFKDNLVWGGKTKKGLLFYEQPFLNRGLIPVSTQGRDRTGTVSH